MSRLTNIYTSLALESADKSVNKFGRNIEVNSGVTADIHDGGDQTTVTAGDGTLIWVAPTAARVHAVVSSSAADTSAGAGAKTIRVYGLTSWDSAETSEVIIMAGATPVNTVNSYVIIHRMKVLTKGASGPNAGIIKATAASDGTITAQIKANQGQTQMAIYGVPSVKTAYLISMYAAGNKAGGASGLSDINLLVNETPDDELTAFTVKHTSGIDTAGIGHFQHNWALPNKFNGPCIIKVQALSGTLGMDISAGFDIYLEDAG